MSDFVDVGYVNQYKNNLIMFVQQKGARLNGLAMEEPWVGEYAYFDILKPTAAREREARHEDTTYSNTENKRRRAEKKVYFDAELVDPKLDLHNMLIDPTSKYAVNQGWAMGRSKDDVLIAAFTATAYEGKDGSSSVAFPTATQQIATSSLNLNYIKILQAGQKFVDNEYDEDNLKMVVSGSAVTSLLQQNEAKSIDYNTIKPLVEGKVVRFGGFDIIRHGRLPKTSNTRSCYAWHPAAMGFGIGDNMETTIDRLPGKHNNIQIYTSASYGAVRILDEGVVEILVDESAGPA